MAALSSGLPAWYVVMARDGTTLYCDRDGEVDAEESTNVRPNHSVYLSGDKCKVPEDFVAYPADWRTMYCNYGA